MSDPWQNRIVAEGEEPPDQLLANPKNWRIHPRHQQAALEGVLDDVGWVQRVIVNRRTGHLIDGHLRVTLALRRGEPTIPVLYVDLDEREEALVLATLDPIAALAAADREMLGALLEDVKTGDAAVMEMLANLAEDAGVPGRPDAPADALPPTFTEDEIVQAILDHWPDWRTPEDVVATRITPAMAMAQFNALRAGAATGHWIAALFTPHRMASPKANDRSYFDGLFDPEVRRIMALYFMRHRDGGDFHPGQWAGWAGFGFGGLASADDFRPAIARDIYRQFCPPDADVLDPCHGWGGRLVGWAASGATGRYVGCDPATKTSEGVGRLAAFLRVADRVTLHCQPFEDADLGGQTFGMALTSPPYFDTEHYSDEDTQSAARYPTFARWVDGFYRPLVAKTLDHLTPGAPFVLNVGNCRYDLTGAARRIAASLGASCDVMDGHRIGRALTGGDESIEDFLLIRRPTAA